MKRRAVLGGLAAMLLPGIAVAQAPPPGYAPPPGAPPPGYAPPPGSPPPGQPPMGAPGRGGKRQREPVATMTWDQISPKRRRKLQQRLAGPGNPPLAPDQARAMWDSMTPQQRRQAAKRQPGEAGGRRQQMGQPPQ